jgi:uncharacterized membrane protein
MFPTGMPGLALLILRASVAIALVAEIYGHRNAIPVWLQVAAALISLALAAGCLTPIAGVLALAVHAIAWSRLGAGGEVAATVVALDVIALVLLGPGAYSFDSYRFGRRVVVLPPT